MPFDLDDADAPPVPIIDVHQHVGDLHPQSWQTASWRAADQTERAAYLSSSGIDRCVIMPMASMTLVHTTRMYARANDVMHAYAGERPDLTFGWCATVNPADADRAAFELQRSFVRGALGMSFHHRYLGMNLNDPRMLPLLEIAQGHQKLALMHVIAESEMEAPWRLFSLARRFPSLRFIALDGFSSPQQAAYLLDAAGDYPNVWYDTGVATAVAHGFEKFIETHGADRLMIGTDNYSGPRNFYTTFPIEELRAMGLPDEDLHKIAHLNIRRLAGETLP